MSSKSKLIICLLTISLLTSIVIAQPNTVELHHTDEMIDEYGCLCHIHNGRIITPDKCGECHSRFNQNYDQNGNANRIRSE